jgi:uncharacterized membrane protein YcaP (DUF421 family)
MEIMLRATAIYFFLWVLTRGLGKRELAEITDSELLLLVLVGDLIQQGVTQEDTSVTGASWPSARSGRGSSSSPGWATGFPGPAR